MLKLGRQTAVGRGGCGGQVMLALYSDDPSSNPTDISSFYSVELFEKHENKTKRHGSGHLMKTRQTAGQPPCGFATNETFELHSTPSNLNTLQKWQK